jgi:hypothetical protein
MQTGAKHIEIVKNKINDLKDTIMISNFSGIALARIPTQATANRRQCRCPVLADITVPLKPGLTVY